MRVSTTGVAAISILFIAFLFVLPMSNTPTEVRGVTGPDFDLILATSSLNIPQGSSGSTTVIITSVNGFSGTVSLTESVSPAGPAASLSPSSVTVAPGASGGSTLTVSTVGLSPFNSGSYSINVTGSANGSSGPIGHSVIVSLTVSSSSSGLGGIYSLVALGVFVVIVLLIFFFARRRVVKK